MNRKAQRLRAVLFDFDGTIADTGRGIKNSIRYSLEKKQIPVGNPENLDYFIGPPLYEGYAHVYGTKEPLTSELVDLYRVYYAEKGVYELDVYPGIRELLENLRAAGVKTAVTSSKPL
ncbi:MAG TPA: HAD hydrolase-like protein, partial [Clostridiales bacterium]|nr:HAD hydrolase-like protein [Clostridiales bacterium]